MTLVQGRHLVAAAEGVGVALGAEALRRILQFVELLWIWNRRVRLVGAAEIDDVLQKHVVDCLAPAPFLPPRGLVLDIGSGAGFPGIVLGCLRPDLQLMLVESRRRRVHFLREAIRAIPLPNAHAIMARAEAAVRDASLSRRCDVVIARGLRLDTFLALAEPFLAPSGIAIAMQTPGTASRAAQSAGPLRLFRRHDYRLPAGERRALLFFAARSD